MYEIVGTAADAVAGVKDENAENAQAIFNLVKDALRDRAERDTAVNLGLLALKIGEFAALANLLQEAR